ncbi:MAG TPA: glycosyltransferase [Opitutus sp.]|nr:glycosyltransferase [Opitutus sp.]
MRISVLIDSGNNGQFIEATVESVLNQTRVADEIIVSDDGSTDDTCEVIRRRFGGRVIVAGDTRLPGESHRARQAASIARAFLRSTGDLVFLLDGDDLFLPQRIERYAAVMESIPDVVMVQSPLQHIDAAGGAISSHGRDHPPSDDLLPGIYRRQDLDCFYSTSALAFRRSFLQRTLPLDLADGIDLWTDYRLCIAAAVAGRVVTLADITGCWRRHAGSASLQLFKQRTFLPRLALARVRYFNRCRQGTPLRPLQPWRSGRFYLRWLHQLAFWA